MSDTILVATDGPLRTITLNRPDKLNAFNEDMHLAFRAALEAARDDDGCRAVLLTGAGRGFCAGQDLGDRDPAKGEVPDLGETLRTFFNPNIRLIRDMPKPIIAAVNGAAAGAGANIALACDIVLAARNAKFLQAFARIGLIPDAGGSWTLTQLVGPARARGLAMLAEATDMAARLANGPTTGLTLTKQAILAATESTLEEQLDREAELQARAGTTADYREGVSAFLEKRAPRFTGR